MEIKAFNGEYFERWRTWYIIFTIFVVFFVIFNILYWNFWGIIIFFIVLWIYFYFLLQWQKRIKIKFDENWVYIDTKYYPWTSFLGFTIEIDPVTRKVKNIVFVLQNGGYLVYTIDDDENKFKEFTLKLSEYLPVLEQYNQSFFDKLLRVLKL